MSCYEFSFSVCIAWVDGHRELAQEVTLVSPFLRCSSDTDLTVEQKGIRFLIPTWHVCSRDCSSPKKCWGGSWYCVLAYAWIMKVDSCDWIPAMRWHRFDSRTERNFARIPPLFDSYLARLSEGLVLKKFLLQEFLSLCVSGVDGSWYCVLAYAWILKWWIIVKHFILGIMAGWRQCASWLGWKCKRY